MMNKLKIAAILAGSAALAAPAFGSSIGAVEASYTGSNIFNVSIGTGSDPTAVVTAILSTPGTFNTVTYTNYASLVNDGTGSLDVYGSATGLYTGYTPTVGDAITVTTAEYSPFHQLPELEKPSTGTYGITLDSQHNTAPGAITATIEQMNVPTLPYTIAGYLVDLNNVSINDSGAGDNPLPGSGLFGTSNLQLTVTDGTSSEELYYYPSSYSLANINLSAMQIPIGEQVDMVGIASVYPTGPAPEFIPMSITVVPEPLSAGLMAIGSVAMLMRRRRTA
jgi:hypothetical protein